MNFDLSDEQKMLAEQAQRLLAERSPPERLRRLIETDADWDEPLWREVARSGFLGTAVPQAYGGLGLTELELGVLSEEFGRANVALPFFSSIVLAANAIALAGSEQQKREWLPRIVSGELIATLAYAEGPRDWSDPGATTNFVDGAVSGTKLPVADAGVADLAIVTAKDAGHVSLVAVDLRGPRVARKKLSSFDQLRPHYEIALNRAPAARLTGAPADQVLPRLFDLAAVQAAFEAVGGAEACLKMARDHAMQRQIFGRRLASYQAIKHKLADLLVNIELARSSAIYAAWAAIDGEGELPCAASAARLMATNAFENAARENIQVHGGIGYTFEANCHFYYRRERTLAVNLGSRQRWADRLIAHAQHG
jgi:acyl-CoA dehydrogenase